MTLPPVPQTGRRPYALPANRADDMLRRRHPHDYKDLFATDTDPEIRRLGRLALRRDDGQARVDDLFAIGDLCARRALDDEGRLRVTYVGKALLAWQRASAHATHDIDRMTSARIIDQFVRWLWQAASEYPGLRNLSVVLWALSSDEPPPRAGVSGVPTTGGPVVADLLRRIEASLRGPAASDGATPGPDRTAEVSRTAAPGDISAQTQSDVTGRLHAGTSFSAPPVHGRSAPLDDLTVSDSADPAVFESMQRDSAAGEPVRPPRKASSITYTGEMSAVGAVRAGDSEYDPGMSIGDRYEVSDIRRGGMGIVFLCYDHQDHEPAALKSFQMRLLDNPRAVARFEQEALTWIRLEKHRHIVQARRVQKFGERPFLILEHVSGPEGLDADLRSWIEHRRMTLPLALNFGLHIALGMQHATQRVPGLVHRDLKPANILVTQDGVAKVTDFGLVRSFDLADVPAEGADEAPANERLTRMGAVLGTAAYLSPEQCAAAPVDQRADVYAFGCVLYEMLSGHTLFPVHTFDEWLHAHLHDTPAFPDELLASLPPALVELTLACLQKAPDGRPSNWSAIVDALAPIYAQVTGAPPVLEISGPALAARELMDKGYSLTELGKYVEAVAAYDRAIALQPGDAWAWARKGRTLRLLGRLPGALEAYDESLRLHPAYAWAWKGKGIVLEKLGRYEEALDCHRAAAQIDPDDVWNWYNQAESLQALGRVDEALQALERGLALDPQHANSWGRLGQLQRTLGHHQAAIDAYRKATEIDPAYGWAHNGCGLALRALGRPAEALLSFKRAARFQPEIVWHWYNLTETLTELGHYEDAVEVAREAVRVDAAHAFSWAKLGQVLRYLKRFDESLAAYQRSLVLQPESAWACNGKGIVLEQLGRFEEALAAYQRASALAPRDVWPAYNQGSVLIALGRPGDARVALEHALTLLPTHAKSMALLGTALHQLGDLAAARTAFEAAVALDAGASWAWNEYGQVLRKLGYESEALEAMQRAGDPAPGETVLVFEQADLLMAQERFDEAVRLLEGYLIDKPRSQYGWAKLGQALRRLRRYDEAIRACDRALELDPGYAWAWNVRGLALMALDEPAEALAAFVRACTLDKNSVWHWYNQSDALAALNRHAEAADTLRQGLALAPGHAESWAKLGQALRCLDRPVDALIAYDRALSVRAGYAWAWHGRGLALQSLGRREEALASFERARQEDAGVVWYYHSQVDLLLDMGRKASALQVAEAAAQALPQSAPAWARLGQVQRRLSRFDVAVESYERAVELDPRYGWAWNGLGLAHTALNHADQSAEAFAEAVRFNPDDVWFWRNYGDALILLDACERALLAFERALALEPGHIPTMKKLALAQDCAGVNED